MSDKTVFATEDLAAVRVSAHVRVHGVVQLSVLHEVVPPNKTLATSRVIA